MKSIQSHVAAFTIASLSITSSVASAASMSGSMSTTGASIDATFAKQFAMSGAAEMSLARLAMKRSTNARVIGFAKKMIADHTLAGAKLKTAAASLPTPMVPDAASQTVAKQLAGLSGAEFDSGYKEANINGHEKALALLQQEVSTGKNSALVAYAKKTTPTVQMHLTMSQALPST